MLKYIKRSAAALLFLLALCSCGNDNAVSDVFYDYEQRSEETTASTIIFSGIPKVSDHGVKKETVTTSALTEPSENVEENKKVIEESERQEVPDSPSKPKPDAAAASCIEAPYFSQEDYPTGCELVSTSMLLAYYGFDISAGELIDNGYVQTSEFESDPNDKDIVYGGDPNYVYIGDPRNETGFGCYSGAIADGLERLLADEYFDCYYLTGMSLEEICSQYIDFGEPVVIWASIDMKPLYYVDEAIWTIKDTGDEFTWLSNEHCMLLVGHDEYYYYFHDPLKGAYTAYDRETADIRFAEMGSQAVTIKPW